MTMIRSEKLLKLAKGQRCVMCMADDGTIVAAHSNLQEHGKGMGLKAKDEHGAYGCSECHATYDRQKKRPEHLSLDNVEEAFTMAMMKSRQILKDKGLI